MSENEGVGVKSVVVTFKCTEKFKLELDEFAKNFDSRSEMIREAIRTLQDLDFEANAG